MGTNDTTSTRGRKRDRVKVNIRGGWTAIPNKLLKDKRVSRDARLLGCIIFMCAANSGRAFPSQEELAQMMSHQTESDDGTITERTVTVRSIQRWLSELRKSGWVDWRQTLRNNEYNLFDPFERVETAPEETEHNDETDNTDLTGATQESSLEADGSCTNATTGSPRTTEESWSTTTEGSPRATEGSAQVIEESHGATEESRSSSIEDSSLDSKLDSSSSESEPTHHPDDDDDVVRFLESLGVTAAREFSGLDLGAVRERVAQLQRDPNCRPGAIVKSLRQAPPQRAKARGELDVERYVTGYNGLFRRGSDVSTIDKD